MFDFEEITKNGYLNEWYAIPVLVALILIKVIAEKKYEKSLDKKKKDSNKES